MTRFDSWLPNPDLSAVHCIEIGAPLTRVYQALKVTDFGANPVVAAIMALRAIPALLASPVATWKQLLCLVAGGRVVFDLRFQPLASY